MMRVPSPRFWFVYHTAQLVDGIAAAIAYWHTNTSKVKWLIIMDVGLLALLLLLFSIFQRGQS
jgi:hypothetical protein